jgi:hypothetical protein
LVVADVAAQDDRILLAVHEEPVIRRRPVPLRGQVWSVGSGDPSSQDELLSHLLESEPREGTLIVPIVGAPGTGKSHLIRWLHAAIGDHPGLVVRHIPREGTSLPDVVDLIFEDVEGAEFDRLRSELEAFRRTTHAVERSELPVERSEQRERVANWLVLRISDLLQYGMQTPWRRAREIPEATRTALCNEDVLPALLTDVEIRKQLVREGGSVHRLAKDIIDGYDRPEGEDEEELGFREEDLLSLRVARGIGQHAAHALLNLKLPGKADAAARLMSDALDVAAAGVIGIGSGSLTKLLEQFRLALARDGKQLLLLFEDIAIARGLQVDLVDAMTTPARRKNKEPLCTMRVAVAITSTYWEEQAPETLSTRAHSWHADMFDLDVPQREAEDRAPNLIGRYLNAARIGIEELKARSVSEILAGVENVCEKCPLHARDSCHPTFGKASNGYGLYPLTLTAARRLSRLSDERSRPRLVLSEVVEPILDQKSAVDERRFPSSPEWQKVVETAVERRVLAEIPIDQLEALEHVELDEADRERAKTVLRTWLDETEDGDDVLKALNLPVSLLSSTSDSTDTDRRTRQDKTEPQTDDDGAGRRGGKRRRPRDDPDDRTIQEWAAGAITLRVSLARELRRAIWDELRVGVRWNELGSNRAGVLELLDIRAPAQQIMNVAVNIANSAGGGALGSTVESLVTLEPNAANARLLLAFHRRRRLADPTSLDSEDLARIRSFVARAEGDVAHRLDTLLRGPRYLTDVAKLMTYAAAPLASLLGFDGKPRFEEVLKATETNPAAPEARERSWMDLWSSALEQHRYAVTIIRNAATRSQGEVSAPTVIDLTLFDERALENDPAGITRPPRNEVVRKLHEELRALAERAVPDESAAIRARLLEIAGHVGEEESLPLKSISDEIEQTISITADAQLLRPREDVDALRAIRLPTSGDAAKAVQAAWVAVRAAERGPSLDALVRLATVDVVLLDTVRNYLSLAAGIIEASTAAALEAIPRDGAGSNSARGEHVRASVAALLDRCEELQ